MIYDRLDKLGEYRGLSQNLDTAIDYLSRNDLSALPEGRHAIDGDRVYASVQAYETKDAAVARYEAHRQYLDIQFVLDGKELCYCCPLEGLEASEPFAADRDVGFYKPPIEGELALPLNPGVFALFFPQDAHKPCCDLGGRRRLRKIVVKVGV